MRDGVGLGSSSISGPWVSPAGNAWGFAQAQPIVLKLYVAEVGFMC